MTTVRTLAILGRNTLELSKPAISGGGLLYLNITIDGKEKGRLTAAARPEGYRFYDVQEFIPDYRPELPTFSAGVNIDYQQFCRMTVSYKRPNIATAIDSVNYLVLKGAGQRELYANYNFLQKMPGKWLTNQPLKKRTSFGGTEWISIATNFVTKPAGLKLQITGTLTDGRILTKTAWEGASTQLDAVYTFDVSPNRILNIYGEQPVAYSVQLYTDVNAPVSEAYYIEPVDIENARTIVYLNSFGRFDTLNMGTEIERSLKTNPLQNEDRNVLRRFESPFYRMFDLTFLQLDEAMKQPLAELLLSREVYIFENGVFQLLDCLTTDIDYANSTTYSDELTLKFRYATNERNY